MAFIIDQNPTDSMLGKKTAYEDTYNPELLFPIPRANKRAEIAINEALLPFHGYDYWNHYEVSWLNDKGKPIVAMAQLIFRADSPMLIESKSMKLYFNSLNNSQFSDPSVVSNLIQQDLQTRVQSEVMVKLIPLVAADNSIQNNLAGICIDDLDIVCDTYIVNPSLLTTTAELITETVTSNLLRSNCLVTGQPDWGSVQISYTGPKINHESLLKYIVSFRNHTEFGEHCVERMFMDILQYCKPNSLTILGCYTRRGGLDINCLRSTHANEPVIPGKRLARQ